MKVKVLCIVCKEYILDCETDNLAVPFVGDMFEHRKDREWAYFHTSAIDLDLVCPMCEWTFHLNGTILTENGIFDASTIKKVVSGETVTHQPTGTTEPLGTESLTELTTSLTSLVPPPLTSIERRQAEMKKEIKKKGWPKGKPRGKRGKKIA